MPTWLCACEVTGTKYNHRGSLGNEQSHCSPRHGSSVPSPHDAHRCQLALPFLPPRRSNISTHIRTRYLAKTTTNYILPVHIINHNSQVRTSGELDEEDIYLHTIRTYVPVCSIIVTSRVHIRYQASYATRTVPAAIIFGTRYCWDNYLVRIEIPGGTRYFRSTACGIYCVRTTLLYQVGIK